MSTSHNSPSPGSPEDELLRYRRELRSRYGGTMSLRDLAKELRVGEKAARTFGRRYGFGLQIGATVRYDTDAFAEIFLGLDPIP